jgi:hypothetical protein
VLQPLPAPDHAVSAQPRSLASAVIARTRRDRDAGMIVVTLDTLRATFTAAIRVADDMRAQRCRRLHGRGEIGERVRVAFDKPDRAFRTHRTGHIEIERGFLCPTDILRRIASLHAVLIELLETAIRRRARRQAEVRTIDGEVGLRIVVAECVDYRDHGRGLAFLGDLVRITQIAGAVSRDARTVEGNRAARSIRHDSRVTARISCRCDSADSGMVSISGFLNLLGIGARRQAESNGNRKDAT